MSPKVLVVDDSLVVRQLVKRALGTDFQVVEAKDGLDALVKIASHHDIELVLCDVNMPNMDGLDFLEKLREQAPFADVPTVMLTTEVQPHLVARAKTLRARGWIVKPFELEFLLMTAKRLVKTAA